MELDCKDDPHMALNDYTWHVYSIKPILEVLACRSAEESSESCSLETTHAIMRNAQLHWQAEIIIHYVFCTGRSYSYWKMFGGCLGIPVDSDEFGTVGALRWDGNQASWEGWGCSCCPPQSTAWLGTVQDKGRTKAGWHWRLEKKLTLENCALSLMGKR